MARSAAALAALVAALAATAFVASRDIGEAAHHAKESVKEAKLAGEALTESQGLGNKWSLFHLPRWLRRDESEIGFDENESEENDEDLGLLQRTLHSMRSFGKTFGLGTEDDAMDDTSDGLGLDYERTGLESGETLDNRLVDFFNLTRRFSDAAKCEECERTGKRCDLCQREHEREDAARCEECERTGKRCDLCQREHEDEGFGHNLKASAFEMSHELQKELGLEKKTLKDKLADVAETLHLKEPSSEKVAAKKVAGVYGQGKESLESIQHQASGKVDSLLKALHIRSPSALERATSEYNYALHRIKVALGQEDPTVNERLTHVFSNARDSTTDLFHGARDFVTEGEVGIRDRWHNMLAKATANIIDARDTASNAVDQTLKRVGVKERTRLEKARDNLDAASHKLLMAVGAHGPTFMEKLRCYSYNAKEIITGHPEDTIVCDGLGAGTGLKDTTVHPTHKGGFIDRILKTIHLRERDSWEKASDSFDLGIHKVKMMLGQETPTVSESVTSAVDTARHEMRSLGKELSHRIPPSLGGTTPSAFEQLSDSTKAQYYKALREGGKKYGVIRRQLDKSLKAAGIKDKDTIDKINDALRNSYHDFGVQLGFKEPSTLDKLSDWAHPLKPTLKKRSDSIWGKAARLLHLQPRTAAETARDAYYQSLHDFKVLTGQEDRTVTEKLEKAFEDSQKWVGHTVNNVGQGVSDTSDAVSANAMRALMTARRESDRLLKKAGIKDKTAMEKARDRLDEATATLWATLGYSEPTLMDRIKRSLIQATGSKTVEVLLDPQGELNPSFFQRMAERVGMH